MFPLHFAPSFNAHPSSIYLIHHYTPLNPIFLSSSLHFTPPRKKSQIHLRIPHCKTSEVEFVKEKKKMTIEPGIRVTERKLIVKDRVILSNVPESVVLTSVSEKGKGAQANGGVFLGAILDKDNSRHVVSLGTLRDVRFLACFRFKLWWMAQKMGDLGRDIPLETQFLLVESKDYLEEEENKTLYIVFLPLVDGQFRAALQGSPDDQLEMCLESGDKEIVGSAFTHSMYIGVGNDPFRTISDAFRSVKLHLKTFKQRHEKKLPEILDYFGWCTWDAFYQEVSQEGVEDGLKSLSAGGTPPKFVIIDDGWQSVGKDDESNKTGVSEKEPPLLRLTGIKENSKFQNQDIGIKNIVNIAKEKHGLKYVYVWHAITGYWGGVRPGKYGSVMKYPNVCNGVLENDPTWKNDVLAVQGLGLVNPKGAFEFYDELHSYLASAGVDGVKVDVQCILETLGAGFGGRVGLTRQYHQALDASVARNFPDNGCIACMSHNTDALYCSKQTAVVRASDDFYPRDPASHTIHIASVAYNSIFLGEIMVPDWDMFHSLHPAAEYHGSARAISGGPIYVSDAPGNHNFDVLRKLVLPDGSILRTRLPGRPTKDCLFTDPARDGVSLLKIWNMNKYTGVLGVYNCQGAAWNTAERKNTFHQTTSEHITGYIRTHDVHFIADVSTDPNWTGDSAVYSHRSREVIVLPHNSAMPVSLKVLEHEIYTVTPIKVLALGFKFAPFGLVDMYNGGGAIEGLKYETASVAELLSEFSDEYEGEGNAFGCERVSNLSNQVIAVVTIEVKGCGNFGSFSSSKPKRCRVGGVTVDFDYESESGLVTFDLGGMPSGNQKFHIVEVEI